MKTPKLDFQEQANIILAAAAGEIVLFHPKNRDSNAATPKEVPIGHQFDFNNNVYLFNE
jgi:hypothetical protein